MRSKEDDEVVDLEDLFFRPPLRAVHKAKFKGPSRPGKGLMDQRGPPVTLQPPMFDPGGTNSVNLECGSMDISISLTPGVEGTGTQAASTEAAAANVGPITRGMESMLNQDNLHELGEIRAAKEDGREQAQGTPRPFQGITPPEVSQLFQVLAGVIERQPAFLQALQQFVARFMPPTQEAANDQPEPKQKDPRHYPQTRCNNDRSRSPRRPTTEDREAKSYQETQQMEDGGRLTPAHSIPQDGGRPPRADAPSCSNCTSQNLTPCQSVPSTPFTATSVCQTDDDQEWPLPGTSSRKRKRNPPAMENDDESMPRLLPVETVVLRSVGKKEVGAFTGKEIREAIERAGVHAQADYTVHRNDKANALSITTRDPALTEKLMLIREIRKGDEANTFQPYKALTRNQCRGVIHLRGQDNQVTPEQLQVDIVCRTQKVVAARPLGKKGNVILITFEGKTRPKRVCYMHEVLAVDEYRPRPLVCFRCHAIGHKMDVCPRENARCGTCGSEHDGMEECTKTPRCTNCDGGHVATSNDCPKRAIPPRSTSTKQTMKLAGKRGVPTPPPPAAIPASQDAGASYAAVTMGTFQSSVPQAYPPQRTDMAMQVLQLQYDGFARVEKQLAELTAAIHKLVNSPVPSPVQRDVPPDEDYDPSESKKEEKRARKERLSALLPSNPHPIPRGLPRWEQVALHRLQSRSMVTPVWRARFHRPTDQQDTGPDPNCIHCGVLATCHHLVWSCPGTSPERVAAINSLPPPLRPTTLREWTHPRTSAPAEQTLVFSSIISYLRSSGTGRYI
ncbi:hypothetical protein HPB47_017897 [Ixodes persulcatus]|uniref:Uncharacterized protein n=2 Tax=Ixodes persulcatus TaxID=34615 RepID=A0AC60QQP2_IXOPE|nr:hypothetical protein HPB47_017897 [Ixodes persulcatus]